MDMMYFFLSSGVRSGAVKQEPTSRYSVLKLDSLGLWSKLEHKVLSRPAQLETVGMEETHLESQLHLEFQFFFSLQILNKQPLLRTGDSAIFCENLHSFTFAEQQKMVVLLFSWFFSPSLGLGPLSHEVKNLHSMPHQLKGLWARICHTQGESLSTNLWTHLGRGDFHFLVGRMFPTQQRNSTSKWQQKKEEKDLHSVIYFLGHLSSKQAVFIVLQLSGIDLYFSYKIW